MRIGTRHLIVRSRWDFALYFSRRLTSCLSLKRLRFTNSDLQEVLGSDDAQFYALPPEIFCCTGHIDTRHLFPSGGLRKANRPSTSKFSRGRRRAVAGQTFSADERQDEATFALLGNLAGKDATIFDLRI